MILPCEVAVKSLIPAIKATLAKQLVEIYQMKQRQAAEILGITQSAVSKYTRNVRGNMIKIENEEIQNLIGEMVKFLINFPLKKTDFLNLFCETCKAARKKGIMCPLCKKIDLDIKLKKCEICFI